ncbi:MAG: 3-methyl-2-oxobutanoate hydroxymethyltransferase [Haloquadratum sp. J07HQX50]|nr:MAG: 3-methyl-2-oxobutanoate hydroxymethyltransferase [Haloquadratum sp. J07HQX50]
MPSVRTIRSSKNDSSAPLTMLTAYDAVTASIVESCDIDMILVGDSMGETVLGYGSTLPVELDAIVSRTDAITKVTDETLVVADLPFLSTGVEQAESIRNCGRLIKQAGADAVKIESGSHTIELTSRLVELGIPVMAHIGLTPQRVKEAGYQQQGDTPEDAERLVKLAERHASAGAFATVLEHIPHSLAQRITQVVDIPTIGIGAGPHCDGQVLVIHDVLGMSEDPPPFAQEFGSVRQEIETAVESYRDAVESHRFPSDAE